MSADHELRIGWSFTFRLSRAKRCAAAWIDPEPRGWERPSDHVPVTVTLEV